FFFFGPLLFFQQKSDIQRSTVGKTFTKAFEPIHLGLADFVGMEIKDAFAVVAFDGEHLGEDGLKPQVFPLGLRNLGLQEFLIGIRLQLDEVGWSDDFFNFAEVNSFSGSRWHLDLFVVAWGKAGFLLKNKILGLELA